MKISENTNEANLNLYSIGLLSTVEKKTCSNLAKSTTYSHDTLYRQLNDAENKTNLKEQLKNLAQKVFKTGPLYLIFDDTRINKPYASLIEGLDIGHDGSSGSITQGLQIVTAMITDLKAKLPIDLEPYISKWLTDKYLTKSEIAWDIVQSLIRELDVELILADAHYATKAFLIDLFKNHIPFLMKLPRNRKVTIGDKYDQLQNILRLKRNQHVRYVQGLYDGLPYYFYVAKVKNGTTIYFISLNYIEAKNLIDLYRMRWNIELFHRTAKQKLGLQDCQSRSLEKQLRHCLFVMHSYAIAELWRIKLKLANVDEAIKAFRIAKSTRGTYYKGASGENFEFIA